MRIEGWMGGRWGVRHVLGFWDFKGDLWGMRIERVMGYEDWKGDLMGYELEGCWVHENRTCELADSCAS